MNFNFEISRVDYSLPLNSSGLLTLLLYSGCLVKKGQLKERIGERFLGVIPILEGLYFIEKQTGSHKSCFPL